MGICHNACVLNKVSNSEATNNLTMGFSDQLKNWWCDHLTLDEMNEITNVVNDSSQNDSFVSLVY